MANLLQQAGAGSDPTSFAPLYTNRIFTGLWTNRSPLRDAATSTYQEKYGMGRQDSIIDGQNAEITPRLTLARRAGTSNYNSSLFNPITRFYSFNTFTLTSEVIRVMADTATTVYDATGFASQHALFTKSAGAGPTYFLGLGNTLYFSNGVDNRQVAYDPVAGTWGTVTNWGIAAPTVAPTVTQSVKPNPYGAWQPNTVYCLTTGLGSLYVKDPNGNMQQLVSGVPGTTGPGEPVWKTSGGVPPAGHTPDGALTWNFSGPAAWQANTQYSSQMAVSVAVNTPSGPVQQTFMAGNNGNSGATPPNWPNGFGLKVVDNQVTWVNVGLTLVWSTNIGAGTYVTNATPIVDPNGYKQDIQQAGKSGPGVPGFQTPLGAFTQDNSLVWKNVGAFAPQGTDQVQYGYEYWNSKTDDLSNMSPKSSPIVITQGNQVTIQGPGSTDTQVDRIVIFRTAQGGSTFLYLTDIANPGAGTWTYVDPPTLDADLNTEWQAQISGEGTPLPSGATCLGYHLGCIFAAVGNVVYVSTGPAAVVGGSSGNAGFNTTFTAQSKITRFWTCSLGLVVFTVRDAYIILGSNTDTDPLYMVVFIEQLPLRSYDCFAVNKTTPYMLLGNNTLVALDPSAGIVEIGFPIADRLYNEFNAAASYVTFHSRNSMDTALYVASGNGYWYRMNSNNAPESGSSWSPRANIPNMGCVQSVEVSPGEFRLLIGSASGQATIRQRDMTVNTDNPGKIAFPVSVTFGNIVLAAPGQLAALSFITLEAARVGTRAGLSLLLGEIAATAAVPFEALKRTRQDPPDLPPSVTLYSDRYHFAQNQKTAWCRHFQMQINWAAEDAANELYTFTIFGQTWQEFRSQ